jgi:RNA polymerase sigma-70 factor (ECF subfamily)
MQSNMPTGEGSGRHISQIETLWTMIRVAHGADGQTEDQQRAKELARQAAQKAILQRYRPAVYRYLLACLGDADAADELCQEFSLRFVRGDFRNANPEKGRFRDLLKSALYHLIVDHHKRRQRGMPQLSPDAPEPAEEVQSTLESDRQFLDAWRADLLNRAWEGLAEEERRNNKPMHTVLHFRAANPELRSAQMAEQLSVRLGKEVSAEWVRKWLHAARERFAEILLAEVGGSLSNAGIEEVEQELIDLELYQYCKAALDRWRDRQAG